jgi:hypothetical protein
MIVSAGDVAHGGEDDAIAGGSLLPDIGRSLFNRLCASRKNDLGNWISILTRNIIIALGQGRVGSVHS